MTRIERLERLRNREVTPGDLEALSRLVERVQRETQGLSEGQRVRYFIQTAEAEIAKLEAEAEGEENEDDLLAALVFWTAFLDRYRPLRARRGRT